MNYLDLYVVCWFAKEILSIANQKGIYIYAVKGNWHLDDTLQSKVMAMASEIGRDLISKRTSEALYVKRSLGHRLGRPVGPGKSKLDLFKIEIEALLSNGSTQKFIAKRYKKKTANLSNWIKKNKIKIFSQNRNLNPDILIG